MTNTSRTASHPAVRIQALEQRLWVSRWSARCWSAIAAGLLLHIVFR